MDQNPPGSSHGQQPQRNPPPVYDTNHGGHYGEFQIAIELANSQLATILSFVGLS
jgi:hypothetical protein